MLSALDIAKYLLSLIDEEKGDTISNLKLQKILYYLQGYYLALFGKPLFNDTIEAWKHGPVVNCVYQEFKQYKSNSIPTDNLKFNISDLTATDRKFIKEIFNIYCDFRAKKLEDMTHNEDPWKNVYEENKNKEITKDSLKAFFEKNVENVFLNSVSKVLKDTNLNNIADWEEYKFNDNN